MKLCDFYSYRIIGKLTAFLQFQEFSLRILPVGLFHFPRTAFSSDLKSRVDNILPKTATLRVRVNVNLDGAPITSRTHTHQSHTQLLVYSIVSNLVFIFRCSSSPINPVYMRHVDSSVLVFSLASYQHSFIVLVFISRFIDS